MITCSDELTAFRPKNWELKPFNLKYINDISMIYPYQKNIFILYKYHGLDDIKLLDSYVKLLDRYYRYGIGFMDDEIYFGNSLFVEKYLVDNGFRYELKIILFHKVKRIRLKDIDKGKVSISKIEKWKRKVVNRQTDDNIKLKLLHPNFYHSLITFVVFSEFEDRPNNKLFYDLSVDGNDEAYRKLKNNYKYSRIYEDKIYNKVKTKII